MHRIKYCASIEVAVLLHAGPIRYKDPSSRTAKASFPLLEMLFVCYGIYSVYLPTAGRLDCFLSRLNLTSLEQIQPLLLYTCPLSKSGKKHS